MPASLKLSVRKVSTPFRLLLVMVTFVTLSTCNVGEHREYTLSQLDRAARLMEADAEQAMTELKGLRTEYLEKDEYYYYLLVNTRISGKLGASTAGMGEQVKNAIDYFEANNDAPNSTFAHFVQAGVYEDSNQPANALSSYLNADRWAEITGYRIPYFNYTAIPYNIAIHYKRNGDYQVAIRYLNKALTHIDTVSNPSQYTHLLYSLELMGISYMYLSQPDSSFYYYDQAFVLADRMEAAYAKQRITANRIELLSTLADTQLAESVINELLAQYTHAEDSAFISLTNLSLARIYTGTNRLKQAYRCIDKALAYVDKNDFDSQLLLYDQLVTLAALDATHSIGDEYFNLLNELEFVARYAPQAKSSELNNLMRQRAGELLSESMKQNESLFLTMLNKQSIAYIGVGATLAMVAVVVVRMSRKKPSASNAREESAIVSYIIQQCSKNELDLKMQNFIDLYAESEEERDEFLDSLLMFNTLSETTLFDGFKQELFGEDAAVPILSDNELFVCYLMSTNAYSCKTIISYLNISLELFLAIIISLEAKLSRGGYKLPAGYKKARKKLHMMPERFLKEQVRS